MRGMVTVADRLRQAREAAGYESAREAAATLGLSYSTYAGHENGSRGPKREQLMQYARKFKVSTDWLLTGRGQAPVEPREVPVLGFVGAGAAANYFAEGQGPFETVPAPEDSTPDTVAVEIRGDSLGAVFNQWLVFYDEVRSPVTPDMIGRLCVVGLNDDRVLVKQIQRSRVPGLFHLVSNTEAPILDVEIGWAAKVKRMVPR
jgi:transcriptional regulator with XRE-family HTH domain